MGGKELTPGILKRADPRAYASLCEKAGYIREAFEFYSIQTGPSDLLHATELAIKLEDWKKAKTLVDKTKQVSKDRVRHAKQFSSIRPRIGSGIDYATAKEEYREISSELDLLRNKIPLKFLI